VAAQPDGFTIEFWMNAGGSSGDGNFPPDASVDYSADRWEKMRIDRHNGNGLGAVHGRCRPFVRHGGHP